MYRQRWAIKDAFKVAKTCPAWEDVQVLAFEAVRLLVALEWVVTGSLFELGATLEWGEVRPLRRLGGRRGPPEPPAGQAPPAPRVAAPVRPAGDRGAPRRRGAPPRRPTPRIAARLGRPPASS